MSHEEKLSYYMSNSNIIDINKFEKKIKVAILGSFTLNGLAETLHVKCANDQIGCLTYVSGYNQYNQDILNHESKLYSFSPDITFLILDTRTILGNFFYSPYSLTVSERKEFVGKKLNDIVNLINKYKERSDSKLVITNFNVPANSPYGILENKIEYGLKDMIKDLNHRLSDTFTNDASVYVYDFDGFVSKFGENNIFDYRQYFIGDIQISLDYIPHLANELMGYIIAILGLSKKCIVLDLDNTLWGGVIGEDGFDGIKLGPTAPGNAYVEFQKCLLSLSQRGIILAINSKNNLDDALQVIKNHPYMVLREENFACIKINWDHKVTNMKAIADELNIGLDSMVFIDDDPTLREFIQLSLPQILTIPFPNDPSQLVNSIMNLNCFNTLNVTEEDLKRGEMYVQQRKRKELEETVSNIGDFLRQLNIRVTIKKADKFTIPRISQLTLKTNQFNLTTRRYNEEDITKFSQDPNMIVECAQIEDKFGDNGITCVYIIKKDNNSQWTIDSFLMSCRIMGREIENGIMAYILQRAKSKGVAKILGEFIPTKKNKPSEDFLQNCGFKKHDGLFVYSLDNVIEIPPHLNIKEE